MAGREPLAVEDSVGEKIPYQNSNVTDATPKFFWERVERLLDYLDEMFTLHSSPNESK